MAEGEKKPKGEQNKASQQQADTVEIRPVIIGLLQIELNAILPNHTWRLKRIMFN
jgi:hypothetical protein